MKSNAVNIYLEKQSKAHGKIMYFLREVLVNIHPAINETLKYGVPFYRLHKNICYLTQSKKDGVYIGFIQGHQLSNEQNILISDGRKQVKIIRFSSLEDALQKERVLKEVLHEALILDELKSS